VSAFAGTVIAAQLRQFDAPERLQAAIEEDPQVRAATIAAAGELPGHSMYVQRTTTGHLCIWDTPSAHPSRRQGGCNPEDDPLGGRPLSISFAYEGGPAAGTVSDARLIGLATTDVDTVQAIMNDGTRRTIPLRPVRVGDESFRAFAYRFRASDLRRKIEPTAVLALDGDGVEIDRQPTGVVR
jgi:hypothetical protein